MARYRNALPQLGGALFLTDGGIETTLIFNEGLELPDFAAFDLLRRPGGRQALRKYFRTYAELAQRFAAGLVLESATWRANPKRGARQGYGRQELAEANRAAIELLEDIRAELPRGMAAVISGCLGPRGDGYNPGQVMSAVEARDYHQEQIETFSDTAADMVTAITMNYVEEGTGIALAARRAEMPVAISFTVETDGRLPTGQPLDAAIGEVDAATGGYPAYYMLNCAHPAHFESALAAGGPWTRRIRGLRANASRRSHAELNESPDLDSGNPVELGLQYAMLKKRALPVMNVLGGCCGTDQRHVEQIARACAPLFR
jgi:S-methylmethionine-dependent homocysteine/selenocysteine methylase